MFDRRLLKAAPWSHHHGAVAVSPSSTSSILSSPPFVSNLHHFQLDRKERTLSLTRRGEDSQKMPLKVSGTVQALPWLLCRWAELWSVLEKTDYM